MFLTSLGVLCDLCGKFNYIIRMAALAIKHRRLKFLYLDKL